MIAVAARFPLGVHGKIAAEARFTGRWFGGMNSATDTFCLPLNTAAFARRTTGRVHFEHPAFRLVSPRHPRELASNRYYRYYESRNVSAGANAFRCCDRGQEEIRATSVTRNFRTDVPGRNGSRRVAEFPERHHPRSDEIGMQWRRVPRLPVR